MSAAPKMKLSADVEQLIRDTHAKMEEVEQNLSTLNTKLFGEREGENAHGRITRAEADIKAIKTGEGGLSQVWTVIRNIKRTIYLATGGAVTVITVLEILLNIRHTF